MGVLPDHAIRHRCLNNDPSHPVPDTQRLIIKPFEEGIHRPGVISYGLSSYGYDVRVGYKFKVFSNVNCAVVDPKGMDERSFVDVDLTPHEHEWSRPDAGESPHYYTCWKCDKSGYFKQPEPGSPTEHWLRGRPLTEPPVASLPGWSCKGVPDHVLIPPNSFALAETVEYLEIPRDVLVVGIGKSTMARCFVGDTTVALVDGSCPTFLELVKRSQQGETVFYGYGHTGTEYVAQPLMAPREVGREPVLLVELDNGESIKCTSDHEFILRSGQRQRADSLRPGDSLLPLYLYYRDYETVYDPMDRNWRATHRLVENLLVGTGVWSERSYAEEVHHIDGCKTNNHPSNLTRIKKGDHVRLHNGQRDMSAQAKRYWNDQDRKQAHLALLHSETARVKARASIKAYYSTPEGKEVCSERSKRVWQEASSTRRQQQASIARAMKIREDVTEETVIEALRSAGTIRGASRILQVDRSAFRRFPNVMEAFKRGDLTNNYRVKSVRKLLGKQSVYCLTAPLTGNFALGAGVIVSNCGIILNVTPLEPEWRGRITLEISNSTPLPVKVYAGEGICQLLFLQGTDVCEQSYQDKLGRYQDQTGLTLPFVK